MKNIFLILFLCPVWLLAQSGFIKAFDESIEHSANFMDVVVDHDTIVIYSLAWDSAGVQGIRFTKFDTLGNELQEVIIVDSVQTLTTTFFRKKIIRTDDGGYAIFGSAGLLTAYFLKVNHDLELEFLVKYIDSNSGILLNTTLLEVSDGFLLVGRRYSLNGATDDDLFIIKTDKLGNEIWRKIYGEEEVNDIIIGIKRVGEDYLLMGSKSNDLAPYQSTWNVPWLLSIDSDGNEKWSWTMPQNQLPAGFRDGFMLADSSWIFRSGTWEWHEENGQYASRPMVLRMDKDFNIVWQQVFGELSGFQWFTDLERTKDGQFLASGNLWHEWADEVWFSSAVHYKFSAHGDSLWMRQDSVLDYAYLMGTDLLSSGSIVSVGYSEKNNPNGGVFGFLMKIGADGCIDTLNCWPVGTDDRTDFESIQVYPNPVQDELTIVFDNDHAREVFIYFYDVMGRVLPANRTSSSVQRVQNGENKLDVSHLPKGLFFYVIRDGFRVLGRGRMVKE